MKCPKCEQTSQRSKLYMPTSYCCTAMGGTQTYYDEDGQRHHHEINSSVGQGRCSNGHILNITASTKCPAPDCDYGHPQRIDVLPPTPPQPEPEYIAFDNLFLQIPRGQ